MMDHAIITLNEPQEIILKQLAESIADRASRSDLPYTEYLDGLERFIFAKSETRIRMMKMEGPLYRTMNEDEKQLLNILAISRTNTLAFMTSVIKVLRDEIAKLL